MNKVVYLKDEEAKNKFAKEAAKYFSKHPDKYSFTIGEIEPDCFFALRWGMFEDCVLIFKLHENFEPIIYSQIIKED